jgi:hypothetical protein
VIIIFTICEAVIISSPLCHIFPPTLRLQAWSQEHQHSSINEDRRLAGHQNRLFFLLLLALEEAVILKTQELQRKHGAGGGNPQTDPLTTPQHSHVQTQFGHQVVNTYTNGMSRLSRRFATKHLWLDFQLHHRPMCYNSYHATGISDKAAIFIFIWNFETV